MSTSTSRQRMDLHAMAPEAYKAMLALEAYVHSGSLGEALIGLLKMRASQINGCAYCLAMHGEEARQAGVPQRKIDVSSGWHEAPALYSEREQAALALTEEITRIAEKGVSDATWQRVRNVFDEAETAQLIMGIAAINVWNRMAISTQMALPG